MANLAKEPKCLITKRDLNVLCFLWKWKTLTTAAIAQKFYSQLHIATTYDRLSKLERSDFIKWIPFGSNQGGLWVLDKRGYEYISPYMNELKQKGYKTSNLLHDYYATIFHLGEWLTHQPANGHLCTEQELRRLHPDFFPDWIPQSTKHRPDGYSVVYQGNKRELFVFEAELTPKSKARLNQTLFFYDYVEMISAVFWLVKDESMQRLLLSCLDNSSCRRKQIHHFILLKDFLERGWMVPLVFGESKGRTLCDLLLVKNDHEYNLTHTLPIPYSKQSDIKYLLQKQKKPMLPQESKLSENGSGVDYMTNGNTSINVIPVTELIHHCSSEE